MSKSEILEKSIKNFSNENGFLEANVWCKINNIYTESFGRNEEYFKEEFQKANNITWYPMAEWICDNNIEDRVFYILKGLENMVKNGWLIKEEKLLSA